MALDRRSPSTPIDVRVAIETRLELLRRQVGSVRSLDDPAVIEMDRTEIEKRIQALTAALEALTIQGEEHR